MEKSYVVTRISEAAANYCIQVNHGIYHENCAYDDIMCI